MTECPCHKCVAARGLRAENERLSGEIAALKGAAGFLEREELCRELAECKTARNCLAHELAEERETVRANQHAADREYKRRLAAEKERDEALAAVRRGTGAMAEANTVLLKLDAERVRLEAELHAKHAQLVEVADKLAHERQVVAAVREGAEQLRAELTEARSELSGLSQDYERLLKESTEEIGEAKARAKTPTEQAVLDAMAALSADELKMLAEGIWCGHAKPAAIAEIARREAAK